jgi:phospholipid/cholesterol/gamma-HCH transport system substrate-binding protein
LKKRTNEIKIGITVVAAILIGVVGMRVMKDLPIIANSTVIYSVYDKVNGLNPGKKILINGVNIGSIKEVTLTRGDSVKVLMTIDRDVDIPKDSRAVIRSTDLLGTKAVVIEKGNSDENLTDNERILGSYDEGAFGEFQEKGLTLGDKAVEVSDNLIDTLEDVRKLLNSELKDDLKGSMKNLNEITKKTDQLITRNQAELDSTISALSRLAQSSDSLATELRPETKLLLQKLQKNSDDLEKLSAELNQTSEQMTILLTGLNEGKGSMGKLMQDPSLYNNLDSLALNLQRLIKNIDRKPGKYLDHVKITLF